MRERVTLTRSAVGVLLSAGICTAVATAGMVEKPKTIQKYELDSTPAKSAFLALPLEVRESRLRDAQLIAEGRAAANDLCVDAVALTLGTSSLGTTADATFDAAPFCGTSNTAPGCWYSIEGNGNEMLASLCGSLFDTKLTVYCGSCENLLCVGGTDDGGTCSPQSEVAWCSEVGTTYLILVHGFSASTGDYEILVTDGAACGDAPDCSLPDPILNDKCDDAEVISIGATVMGSTVGATVDDDESTSCGTSITAPGVWYQFDGNDNQVSVSLCGSDYDTKISVFTGACGALECIGGNDDFCDLQSEISICAEQGETYYVLVHGFSASAGDFVLNIIDEGRRCKCPDVCQTGDIVEGEPFCADDYDDQFNGGCNSDPPVFLPVTCTMTWCGTSGTFDFFGEPFRDTDWYKVAIPEGMEATWRVEADFAVLLGIIDTGGLDTCEGVDSFLTSTTASSCAPESVTATLSAGVWYFFVAPSGAEDVACGSAYRATLTCQELPKGACCTTDGGCVQVPEVDCDAAGGLYNGDGTFCPPENLGDPGRYLLGNHPDGNAAPPGYGLRLDGLRGSGIYTFDFEDPQSEVFLDYDGTSIHIHGTAFGGLDTGSGYDPGDSSLVEIDFTYDVVSTVAGDDDLEALTPHQGTLTWLDDNTVYPLYAYQGSFDFSFRFGNEDDDNGHRGFDGLSGWGWLNHTVPDVHIASSDWLFTATPAGVECPDPPVNDECVDAIQLHLPFFEWFGSNILGEEDDVEDCGTSITGSGVWHTFVGSGNEVTISTCHICTDYDTKISVFCGSCDSLTCVDGNDDDFSCGVSTLFSTVTVCTQPGAIYYVLVHGFDGAQGNYLIQIQDTGVPCVPDVECIPTGACCNPATGDCTIVTEAECVGNGFSYQGDDTSCGGSEYTLEDCGNAFEDISGTGSVLILGDEVQELGFPIGFTFNFFGNDYTTITISDNGFLTFDPSVGAGDLTFSNQAIPDPGNPNDVIAPFWDDLDTGAGGTVYTQTDGVSPNQRFIVQWTDVPQFFGTDSNTFQAILFEDGSIEFRYGLVTPPSGTDVTIGLENADGTFAIAADAPSVSEGSCLRFNANNVPNPCPIPNCPGDFNFDGKTDVFDFNILAANFGRVNLLPWANGDCDGDCDCDVFDFNVFAPSFGCE